MLHAALGYAPCNDELIAQRGHQFSYGAKLAPELRVAASSSATPGNTLMQADKAQGCAA